MTKFKVEWTEEVWQKVFIEADSKQEALDAFWQGDFDKTTIEVIGGEVQDGMDFEEVG
jgi:hypothetical protein